MVTTLLYLCLSEKKSETQQPTATSPTSSCEGTSCANDNWCLVVEEKEVQKETWISETCLLSNCHNGDHSFIFMSF